MKIAIEFDSVPEAMAFLMLIDKAAALVLSEGEVRKTPVREAGLTVRATNCLLHAGYEYVEDAQAAGATKLLKINNCGRLTAVEVMEWLPRTTKGNA